MEGPWVVNDPSPRRTGFICLALTLQPLLQPLKRQFSLRTQGSAGKHTLINSIYYSCLQPCNPLTSRSGYSSCPATLFADKQIGFVQRQRLRLIWYKAANCSYCGDKHIWVASVMNSRQPYTLDSSRVSVKLMMITYCKYTVCTVAFF